MPEKYRFSAYCFLFSRGIYLLSITAFFVARHGDWSLAFRCRDSHICFSISDTENMDVTANAVMACYVLEAHEQQHFQNHNILFLCFF